MANQKPGKETIVVYYKYPCHKAEYLSCLW